MRHLILYIKSCFCDHKWNLEEIKVTIYGEDRQVQKVGVKVSATCTKCGWHRKYWKW